MRSFNLSETNGFFSFTVSDIFAAGYTGKECNRIDYTASKDTIRRKEKDLLSSLVFLPASRLFFLDQEHGDRIIRVDHVDDENAYCVGTADALVSDRKGFCLVIRSADCVPIILADPVKRAIAAVHSGWKGSALGIAGKTVSMMRSEFGSDPNDILAYILPSIGPDSYQVSKDVAEKFPGCFRVTERGYYLDLWKSVELSLTGSGIRAEHIHNNRICTLARNGSFFSHRGGDAGRMLSFIFIR